MNAGITIEPLRFGRTGPSHLQDLRDDFLSDAEAYALDAPAYIARGSLKANFHRGCRYFDDYVYISATEARP